MKKLTQLLTVFAAAGLMSACASYDLDMVQSQKKSGDPFLDALHSEYLQLAKDEDIEDDWKDAEFFSKQATRAAAGEDFEPQEVGDRNIPDDLTEVLEFARGDVMGARTMEKNGPNAALVARAQAKFDCWLQEQEENNQPEDIEKCRTAFNEAFDAMVMAEPAPMAKPAPAAPAPKAMPQPRTFVVYFEHDSAKLDDLAMIAVKNALKEARLTGPKSVLVGGHADTSGDQVYNNNLSQMRAKGVAKVLFDGGLRKKKMIKTAMFGEDFNAVDTGDGVKNRGNRRVEITLKY